MEEKKETVAGEEAGQEYKVGPGRPPLHTQFGKRPQPDPKKSWETRRKKMALRDKMKEMLDMPYNWDANSQVKKQLETAFGKRIYKMTVGEVMALQTMQKAILRGDSKAMNDFLNQAYGMPKQINEHSGINGGPIQQAVTTTQVVINNPHAKKKESE